MEPSTRRRLGAFRFDEALWSPMVPLGEAMAAVAWTEIRGKLLECFGILRDLLGYPAHSPDDPALDSFCFAAIKGVVDASDLEPGTRDALLQIVAARRYHLLPSGLQPDPLDFWVRLNQAQEEYRRATLQDPRKNRIMVMIRRLFAEYGLSAGDHLDIHLGVYRSLVPLLVGAAGRLQEANEADGAPAAARADG